MGITKVKAKVVSQTSIAQNIYDMRLAVGDMVVSAKPGQFVSIYSNDGSRLLPRPISICEIDKDKKEIRVVYRVVGEGTKEFSRCLSGDELDVMGPLGNGYTLKDKKAIIIGGGIGIPPMLELAKRLKCEKNMVLGYRDETFLKEEFEKLGQVYTSSDSGVVGVKGTVLDAIEKYGVTGDIIYACGPMPMLKAIKSYAKEHGIEAQISLEERMACGIGACLGCVCKSKEMDEHTHVHNKRICKDGPVFDAEEVEIE